MLKKIKDMLKNKQWKKVCNKQEKCSDCQASFHDGDYFSCKFDYASKYGDDEVEIDEVRAIR